jgi:hypothetical protein
MRYLLFNIVFLLLINSSLLSQPGSNYVYMEIIPEGKNFEPIEYYWDTCSFNAYRQTDYHIRVYDVNDKSGFTPDTIAYKPKSHYLYMFHNINDRSNPIFEIVNNRDTMIIKILHTYNRNYIIRRVKFQKGCFEFNLPFEMNDFKKQFYNFIKSQNNPNIFWDLPIEKWVKCK